MNIPVTKATLFRLIVIVTGVFVAMALLSVPGSLGTARYDIAPGLMVGSLLAFLLFQAAERRRAFVASVYMELNKLRRIYHLSKSLSVMDQKYRAWFTDLHGYLVEYMSSFQNRDMDAYSESNAAFRKVSYNIYKIPDVGNVKEEALFNELLRTSATIAEARQNVKELRRSRLSAYAWIVILLMVAGFAGTVYLSTADTEASRLAGACAIAIAFLAVDLLWEVDTLASERKGIAQRYVINISKLQLGREESSGS
jgi:hypothetical protein